MHAGDAAGEGVGRGRGPLSEDRVLAGAALPDAGRAGRQLCRLARPGRCNRRLHATGRFLVAERLGEERGGAAAAAAGSVSTSRWPDGPGADRRLSASRRLLLSRAGRLVHERVELHASTATRCGSAPRRRRSPATRAATAGRLDPQPRMRPEPPPAASRCRSAAARIDAPELADYAELCA